MRKQGEILDGEGQLMEMVAKKRAQLPVPLQVIIDQIPFDDVYSDA